MQFVREISFLLLNVPALAHRYQSQSVLAAVFLVLSAASILIKNRLVDDASTRRTWLKWIARTSLVLSVMMFVLAFIDLVKNRLSFDEIVCTDISDDAYYHVPEGKTYELVERFRCSNRTGASVRNLADLSDGFSERISSWTPEFKLLGRPSVALVIHKPSESLWKSNYAGGTGTIYLYRASAEFDPPLSPGAEFDLVSKLTAHGSPVETAAFSTSGTSFVQAVPYETLSYYVTIHAPPGFEIRLRNWGVIDQGGLLVADETQRQEKPNVSPSGGLLQWRVSLTRLNLRYMLSYWFEAYGWQKP